MARKRINAGDSRHIAVDFKQIARTQKILGIIAAACFIAAFIFPTLQGWLILVGIFAGLGIGWVE